MLRHLASPLARQTAFLFAVDGLANGIDYLFHVTVGRSVAPGDFAVVQTVNGALLIVVTAAGVLQPVVARYVAQARTAGEGDQGAFVRGIFRYYVRQAALLGGLLGLLVWLGRSWLGRWLNVPAIAVALGAGMVFLALLRPVVAGMLQGQQRFVAFGSTRLAYAAGRFLLALLFLGILGGGAVAAIAAIPLGAALSLAAGLLMLGLSVWQEAPEAPVWLRREGRRLSASALVAYTAYMGLLNLDLIWVNRAFSPDVAGNYATAVLLRRVLSLLPGAVIVILFPRVASRVTRGRPLDGLLARASAAIVVPSLLLSAAYFTLGEPIVRLTFGRAYAEAAPLLGWLGLAMTGYALASVWMNTYLATRPGPYVLLLAGTAVAQLFLYAGYHTNLSEIMIVFAGGGWFLAIAGFFLYAAWLRPTLGSHWQGRRP